MATRFYLPASGSPPLASLAVDTNWERTNSLARLPCFTTKQNTSLATTQMTWPGTTTVQWVWYQFQSDILKYAYNWLATDTVSMVLGKLAETSNSGDSHLAYLIRVVSGDGATIRGVIGLYHATSSEFPLMASAATRIHDARTDGATAFSSQAGDRIIVEIGLHGFTPAAELIQMRVGDPSATADFALTAGLTTDLDPWVQLSRTVEFGTPPEEHSGAAVLSGNGAVSGVVQKGGKGSALNSGKGALVAVGVVAMMGLAALSGGPGHQVASGLRGAQGIAAISGNGSVTATGEQGTEQHSGSAILSGQGTIFPTGAKGASNLAAISGKGTLTSAGAKTDSSAISISGNGSVSGIGRKAGLGAAGPVSANGAQVAGGVKAAHAGAAISGKGSLIATGEAGGSEIHSGTAVISGGGSLWPNGIKGSKGPVGISGRGVPEASGAKSAYAMVAISGNGSFVASGDATGPALEEIRCLSRIFTEGVRLSRVVAEVNLISRIDRKG